VIGRYLDAGLLVAAVDRRGGPDALGRGLPRPERTSLLAAYSRAVLSGRVTVTAADRLAITGLGLHPALVFGPAWYDGAEPRTRRYVPRAPGVNRPGDAS